MKNIKPLIAVFITFGSGVMEVIANGRQIAWAGALKNWDCDSSPPLAPSVFESLASAGLGLYLVSFAVPLVLSLCFLATSKSLRSLFFWYPIMALQTSLSFLSYFASYTPAGYCGDKSDFGPSFGYGLAQIGLLLFILFTIYSVFLIKQLYISLCKGGLIKCNKNSELDK